MGQKDSIQESVQQALDKTVQAYKDLIDDPSRISEWGGYGSRLKCRLCLIVLPKGKGCQPCSLYKPKPDRPEPMYSPCTQ